VVCESLLEVSGKRPINKIGVKFKISYQRFPIKSLM